MMNKVEMYCTNCMNWNGDDCILDQKTAQNCIGGMTNSYVKRIDEKLLKRQLEAIDELNEAFQKCAKLNLMFISYQINVIEVIDKNLHDKIAMKHHLGSELETWTYAHYKYNAFHKSIDLTSINTE